MKLPLYGMIRSQRLIELYEINNIEISQKRITTYEQIVKIFNDHFRMDKLAYETVYLLSMMSDGSPIGICEISKGNSQHSNLSINTIAKVLLLTGADSFVVLHNHPNNSCKPSDEDVLITNKILEMANLLEVDFEDHIIICRNDWTTLIHKRR